MDFREEYKKQAEVMTPSAEAMERMTKNIMEQMKAPVKKTIPFRKISYIGGAVAACAIITVGAVKLLPSVKDELATADAAASESSAYMYQDAAVADEEGFFPVDGAIAEADSDNAKQECALGDSTTTLTANNAVYDEAIDAAEDTAAIVSPILSENEDVALPSDKTFAEGAPTEAVKNTAPEENLAEEAEAAAEGYTEEFTLTDENVESDIDAGTIAETIPECSAELIYVADDMHSFTIGGIEYVRFPQELTIGALPEENSIAYYIGSDGKQYRVTDFGDIVILTHNDFSGIYCTLDMYDEIVKQQN